MRTGTRCSTLTKLPVALSDRIIENAAPVTSDTASTTPLNSTPGTASTVIVTGAPMAMLASCVSR